MSSHSPSRQFVPETRIGAWFQGTNIWHRYVVCESFADLRSLLPSIGPINILLDVGCGDGRTLPLLEQAFRPRRIVALDFDVAATVRAAAVGASMCTAVDCVSADVCRMPLPASSADVVYCHQTLHHTVDPVAALKEMHRVLVPGGLLLVSESCRSFLSSWSVRLFFRHPSREQQTAAGYVAMLREAGFEIDENAWLGTAPWWSRSDIGIRERFFGTPYRGEATQVRIVARRRASASSSN